MRLASAFGISDIDQTTRYELVRLFGFERALDLLGIAERNAFDKAEASILLRSADIVGRNDYQSVIRILVAWNNDNRKHSLFRYDRTASLSASP
jgi:hypothetical protein